MDSIYYLYLVMDALFMYFYRLPDNPLLGYFLGTFLLSCACVILGKYSLSVAFRFNRKKIDKDIHEIEHYQNLSIEALKRGNRTAYEACNSIARDAYGKNFFFRIALSASSLWPVFIALGWMQYHFPDIALKTPVSYVCNSCTVGYGTTFLLCYVSARLFTSFFSRQAWCRKSRFQGN